MNIQLVLAQQDAISLIVEALSKKQMAIYLTQPAQDVVVYGVRGVSTHFG